MAEQHKPGENVQTSGIYKGERTRRWLRLRSDVCRRRAFSPQHAAARVRATSWFTARRTRTSAAATSRYQPAARRTKGLDHETPGAAAPRGGLPPS
jgi:hypothetical protein